MNGNGNAPSDVPVQPTPTIIGVGHAPTAKGEQIILRISTPLGISVHFIDPDAAEKIGKDLQAEAVRARSGLTIVGDGT